MLVWLRSSSGAAGRHRGPRAFDPGQVPVATAAVLRIKILQRVAGRMVGRDIQRLEIVPFVFDFRPVGDGESQPAHDLFQFFDRLRDRMQMAERGPRTGLRRIKRRAGWRGSALGQSRLGLGEAASSSCLTSLNRLPAAGLSGPGRSRALFARP